VLPGVPFLKEDKEDKGNMEHFDPLVLRAFNAIERSFEVT